MRVPAARLLRARRAIQPTQNLLRAVLLVGVVVMLFPIVWMGVSTFKSEAEINAYPPTFLPRNATLQPLRDAWVGLNLPKLFANSLFL
ncbi:MAG: carbohydrate ABC transporter permease, partial [Anaerolineae bacterium]|nr:carbohydrate ABC transporter permease [Anaerolineae bacterium]